MEKEVDLEITKFLKTIVFELDKRLEIYWDGEIEKNFGYDVGQKRLVREMLKHIKDHNMRGGKRLRAALVCLGYLLNNDEVDKKIWRVMEGVELVHTALLIHDDFMDEDKLRRGSVTTHEYYANGDKHYGDSMAVNAGDVVMNLGYSRILESGFEPELLVKMVNHLVRGVANTAFGQAYDVSLPKLGKMESEAVLAVQWTKTAIYTFENPLWMGAWLGGADEGVFELIKIFSEKIGIAFQMQDDILGVFGDTSKTGKSDDSDLRQKKITLLITKVMELGSDEQKKMLLNFWRSIEVEEKMIGEIKEIIVKSGALSTVEREIKRLSEEALMVLEDMKRKKLNQRTISLLHQLVDYMMDRDR